jgi:hypothetical protein
VVPVLREVPVEPPARVLRCTTCDAAWAAAHGTARVSRVERGAPSVSVAARSSGSVTSPGGEDAGR